MSLVTIKNFDVKTAKGLIRCFNSFFNNYTPYYKVLPPCDNKVDILAPLSGFFKRHIYARWI